VLSPLLQNNLFASSISIRRTSAPKVALSRAGNGWALIVGRQSSFLGVHQNFCAQDVKVRELEDSWQRSCGIGSNVFDGIAA
jgi:hypothetical protein